MNILSRLRTIALGSLFLVGFPSSAVADSLPLPDPEAIAPPRQILKESVLPELEQSDVLHLTLSQVLERTLVEAPSLEEGLAKLKQRMYEVEEAYTAANPTASFQAQYQRLTPDISFGDMTVSPHDNYNLTLTLEQPIYTFGRLRYATLAAKLNRRSEQESYLRSLQELLAGAAQLYINAVLADDAMLIAEDQLLAQQANHRVSSLLAGQGVVAKFDVLRTGAALSEAEQDLIETRTARDLALKRLKSVLNLNFRQTLDLHALSLEAPPEIVLTEKKEEVLAKRSDLRALRWAVEAARTRVHLARSENAPRLSLQNQTVQRNSTIFSPGTQNTTMLVFSVPLSDGGASKARALQAEAQVEQMLAQLEARERQVVLEVEQSYAQLQDNWNSIRVAKENVAQSQEAARIAKLRYENGLSTSVELLQSQADLSRARYSLNQSQAVYHRTLWTWYQVSASEFPVEVPLPPEIRERLQSDQKRKERNYDLEPPEKA